METRLKANYDHDNDQFRVKTKRLARRMTAQPSNRFVFVSWSWHLSCNGSQALWLSVVVCLAAYVSTHNFTYLRGFTFSLIGHPIGKLAIPIDTSWASTAGLTTIMKIAVVQPPLQQQSNHQSKKQNFSAGQQKTILKLAHHVTR